MNPTDKTKTKKQRNKKHLATVECNGKQIKQEKIAENLGTGCSVKQGD